MSVQNALVPPLLERYPGEPLSQVNGTIYAANARRLQCWYHTDERSYGRVDTLEESGVLSETSRVERLLLQVERGGERRVA